MSTRENRTNATCFYTFAEALNEIDALKFAVSSLPNLTAAGSRARENSENAVRGIKARLDYLHDCVRINSKGLRT